jgi:flagellar biosynthetic protein FliR
MEELVKYIVTNEVLLIFILARVSAFLVAIPILDGSMVPNSFKIFLAFSISLMLLPLVHLTLPPLEIIPLTLGLFGEALIGLIIGFGVKAIFSAVEVGAELSGLQMGFGIANIYNPLSGQTDSVIGRFELMLAFLVFFGINAHHMVIHTLVFSFSIVPSSGFIPSGSLIKHLISISGNIFFLGMKIAVPVTVTLLLANGALGLLSRLVPQINLFMTSFAVTIGLGLIVLGASLSVVVTLIRNQLSGLDGVLLNLLREVRGI